MSVTITAIILVILFIMNLKWIAIVAMFPFQVANVKRRKIKDATGRKVWYLYLLAAPYIIWERLMHNGWQRYMLFQIGMVPSLHLRKWVYKCLGAHIEHDAVFHFRTEIRCPERLVVRGGNRRRQCNTRCPLWP